MMGKTCEPKAFSFQCMTKFTTNKKKKRKEKEIKKKSIYMQRIALCFLKKNLSMKSGSQKTTSL